MNNRYINPISTWTDIERINASEAIQYPDIDKEEEELIYSYQITISEEIEDIPSNWEYFLH